MGLRATSSSEEQRRLDSFERSLLIDSARDFTDHATPLLNLEAPAHTTMDPVSVLKLYALLKSLSRTCCAVVDPCLEDLYEALRCYNAFTAKIQQKGSRSAVLYLTLKANFIN